MSGETEISDHSQKSNGWSGTGSDTVDGVEVLNREKLGFVFDEDTEYLKQFLESFLEICPRYMADVREAVGNRDQEGVASSAHRLHSSLESLQADAAAQVAAQLERAARAQDIEDAPQILERLEREIERLKQVLREETVSS